MSIKLRHRHVRYVIVT